MTAVVARARGLGTTVLPAEMLAELERADTLAVLRGLLARAGVAIPTVLDADAVDRIARDRVAADLAILGKWSRALEPFELDEDRRSVRAIVRGIAAAVPADRRAAGCVPTQRLPSRALDALAACTTVAELAAQLARRDHPLAPALAPADRVHDRHADRTPAARAMIDPLAIELQLAHRFAELARPRDAALATYVAQVIDAENTAAAILLATRGTGLVVADAFVPGGRLVDAELFDAAATAGPLDPARDRLARALAGTPLARALASSSPAAVEDAALAWQLQAQRRLRRVAPLGLAPVIYVLLRRRDEARHLRRAGWRLALGGAA